MNDYGYCKYDDSSESRGILGHVNKAILLERHGIVDPMLLDHRSRIVRQLFRANPTLDLNFMAFKNEWIAEGYTTVHPFPIRSTAISEYYIVQSARGAGHFKNIQSRHCLDGCNMALVPARDKNLKRIARHCGYALSGTFFERFFPYEELRFGAGRLVKKQGSNADTVVFSHAERTSVIVPTDAMTASHSPSLTAFILQNSSNPAILQSQAYVRITTHNSQEQQNPFDGFWCAFVQNGRMLVVAFFCKRYDLLTDAGWTFLASHITVSDQFLSLTLPEQREFFRKLVRAGLVFVSKQDEIEAPEPYARALVYVCDENRHAKLLEDSLKQAKFQRSTLAPYTKLANAS